jgi:hypothetical protein
MRLSLAGSFFYLQPSDVELAMHGVVPEQVKEQYVIVGQRQYPIKQVGAAITGQDPRDMSAMDVRRALTKLGFECRSR